MKELLRSENRNIFIFYLLSVFTNFWFISSNWIYFWTRYMTYGQLGLIDALGFGFALVLEIPTGAIGDLLGKKPTLIIANLASMIGVFMIAFSHSMTPLFIGWMISQLGYALSSGTGEALLYDTTVDLKKEKEFDKIYSKVISISMYTYSLAALVGGFIYTQNYRLPQILWGVGYLLAFICTFFLIEPKVDTIKFSFKNYIAQLSSGMRQLIKPVLRKYLIFALFLIGIYYMYSWGFIKPAIATSFGFYSEAQGIILACLTIIAAYIMKFVPYFRKKVSDILGLTMLVGLMAVGFLAAFFPIGYWGIFAMIAISLSGNLANPWISVVINKDIESKYRATTLSTVALMAKLPYVLFAIIAGNMIQQGSFRFFNLGLGLALLACVIFGLTFFVRMKSVRIG